MSETDDKATRSGSFGAVAAQYDRFRPGPPIAAVDWFLPARTGRVVDLGAGTGALTRLLVDRADDVVAVEPDARMRAVLAEQVPSARAVDGRGESIPVGDGAAGAVLASSSWHWMDVEPTLREIARVLEPNGVLGAVWSGPDGDGPFMLEARKLLAREAKQSSSEGGDLARFVMGDEARPAFSLEIPPGHPFPEPEHAVFEWIVALTADELIGLLGTLSWIITMPAQERERIFTVARRLLAELLGVEGDVTVDVEFRADAWRTRRA